MRDKRWWVFGAIVTVLAVAVFYRSRGTMEDPPLPEASIDPGFQMFPSARTSDGPGTVYRKDSEGQRFIVTTKLIPLLPVQESDEEFGEFGSNHLTRVSMGGLIGMLFPSQSSGGWAEAAGHAKSPPM